MGIFMGYVSLPEGKSMILCGEISRIYETPSK